MGHGITLSDRYGETRKNGQRAWHGLGLEIEAGMDARTGFPKIGLGWDTEKVPCLRRTKDGTLVESTEHFFHVRCDTDTELGVVGKDYKMLQNMEQAEFTDALAGADAAVTLETAGSLYGGRRVFALVKLPEVVKATAEDTLDMYVVVSNGHGGFAGFSVYPTSVRVVCANTLRWSERDASKGLSFRHTGNFQEKVAQARLALGIAQREVETFREQVKALVSLRLDARQAKSFMEKTWDASFGISDSLEGEARMRMQAKRDAEIKRWLELLESERQVLPGIKGTAWAAYNAVSEWMDHESGRFKGVGESDARVASNVFGAGQHRKLKAFRSALELV